MPTKLASFWNQKDPKIDSLLLKLFHRHMEIFQVEMYVILKRSKIGPPQRVESRSHYGSSIFQVMPCW